MNKNCTPEVMKQVVNGSLAIVPSGFFPLENDTAITTSEMARKKSLCFTDVMYIIIVPQ